MFQSPTNRGGHSDSGEFALSTQVQFTHKIALSGKAIRPFWRRFAQSGFGGS